MSYVKTNWQNDQAPAINATNLNKIEQGIYDNDANISGINGTIGVDTNTWIGTTAYGEGDIVIYNDKIYQNISGTSTTTNPAEDTTNWNEITIFDTDSINDDLIDKTKFINNSSTNSSVKTYSCNYVNDKLDTLNDYQDTTISFSNEWRIGQVVYGYGIALPIPVFNPKGIIPTLNITSAEVYTNSGWAALGTLNVDFTSKTQIVLRTSNTIGSNYNSQSILFRLNGSITFE